MELQRVNSIRQSTR